MDAVEHNAKLFEIGYKMWKLDVVWARYDTVRRSNRFKDGRVDCTPVLTEMVKLVDDCLAGLKALSGKYECKEVSSRLKKLTEAIGCYSKWIDKKRKEHESGLQS